MRVLVALMSVGIAGALAACANPPPPAPTAAAPAAQPAAAPMQASGGLDGVYRAPPGGVHGNAQCGTTVFSYPVRVENGVASLQTVSGGRLEGKVAPDGSLLIEAGAGTVRGQFSGNEFNGTYNRSRCSFPLAYKKR